MSRLEVLYLIPYLFSLALAAAVLAFTWSRRTAPGATAFAVSLFGQVLWIGGFILELISGDVPGKIAWDEFQWFASIVILLALPVFAVQYTESSSRKARAWFGASLIAPAILVLLLLIDKMRWVYANPHLSSSSPFPELVYGFTPAIYGFALYSYIIALWSLFLIARRLTRPHTLYRSQVVIVLIALLLPLLGSVLSLLGIRVIPQRDSTPLTVALSNLLLVWGLYRFHIFEVVAVVRDRVFEAMVEPVVILDSRNTIIDINSAMLALLGKSADEVIGEGAKEVFADFPIPIKLYTHVSYARAEATYQLGGLNIHYELTVWPLYNPRKEMTGRIYISHDITAMKQLENELRKLNTELEDRVRARTWELADAYDTTLEGWARTLELRDKETEGHSRRVTETTLKIAAAMGIRDDYLEQIRRGAILHDIGKMGIPDEILHKPGALSVEERDVMQAHPKIAYDLLSPIPFLRQALEIPFSHHEKWDGTGYPQGLKEHGIPMSARIFAVADVWDALSFDRPYNKAWTRQRMIDYFVEAAGKHFDPRVVNVFLGLLEKGEI